MWYLLRFRKNPRVRRGLLIPQSTKPQPRCVEPRVAMSVTRLARFTAVMLTLGMGLLFGNVLVDNVVNDGSRYMASPIALHAEQPNHQAKTLETGPLPALSQPVYFTQVLEAVLAQTPTVLVVDEPNHRVNLFVSGQEVLSAPIQTLADNNSWRTLTSGYYTILARREEQYSSLNQAYYPAVIELSSRAALHGPGYTNTGNVAPRFTLGLQLSHTDIQAINQLITNATPILVHRPTDQTVPLDSLVPRVPDITARSYVVVDFETDTVLAAHNPTTSVPVASLTKLMTALVVAREYDLEGEVLIDQERYVTTLIPRLPGTYRTSILDLLQLLLLESSNEAAEVLATVQGRDVFIAKMNEYASELGLSDTVFTDPSGLDDGNISSANDLLRLTKYLHRQYPFLLSLTTTEGLVTATRVNDFTNLDNFNVIEDLDDFIGGKSGETEAARLTSVSLHAIDFGAQTRTIAIVILGTEDRTNSVRKLHHWVRSHYQ